MSKARLNIISLNEIQKSKKVYIDTLLHCSILRKLGSSKLLDHNLKRLKSSKLHSG